jgi:hypothetical protein
MSKDHDDAILIVARSGDGVAEKVKVALQARGRRVILTDASEAAHIFTIRRSDDSIAVTPRIPMFIRASAWWVDPAEMDSDARFLAEERYATLWAAAALTNAPVINRPRRSGPVFYMTPRAIAAALGVESEVAREVYASGPDMIGASDGDMWGEDAEFRTAPVASLRRDVPLRARRVNPAALYEVVTVVGHRAFAATADPRTVHLDLLSRSVAIARAADVHLATISWAIDESGATPARLNAVPDESELRYAWSEIAAALCEDLAP